MSATATLTFVAANPVRIDWGDGTSQNAPAGAQTLEHTYPGDGSWRVTIQDQVTWTIATQRVQCGGSPGEDCITGANIWYSGCNPSSLYWHIGPLVNPSGGDVFVDWGFTTQVVPSGTSPPYVSTLLIGSMSHMGPYTVTVQAVDDPACTGTVTGGDYPGNPGGNQIIWQNHPTMRCVAPTGAGDRMQLYWYLAYGDLLGDATFTIDWGDGTVEHGINVPGPVGTAGGIYHDYAPPTGQTRTLTWTNEQTLFTVTANRDCSSLG